MIAFINGWTTHPSFRSNFIFWTRGRISVALFFRITSVAGWTTHSSSGHVNVFWAFFAGSRTLLCEITPGRLTTAPFSDIARTVFGSTHNVTVGIDVFWTVFDTLNAHFFDIAVAECFATHLTDELAIDTDTVVVTRILR
jgi:hypothetical protein